MHLRTPVLALALVVVGTASVALATPGGNSTETIPPPTAMETFSALLDGRVEGFETTTEHRGRRFNEMLNYLVLPTAVHDRCSHLMATYLRNFIMGTSVYYLTGIVWCVAIYGVFRKQCFPNGDLPSLSCQLDQIWLAQRSLVFYVMLPTATEFLIEEGYTKAYFDFGDYSVFGNLAVSGLFLFVCEFGVYWSHRGLHMNKFLYKWIHAPHHAYNKANSLSPWASIAFNPIDGIIQAIPYLYCLFFLPIHFLIHFVFLFFLAIWATSIHDCVDMGGSIIMGAGYHRLHHTTYRHNYGQYTVLFDKLFGTLQVPPREKPKTA